MIRPWLAALALLGASACSQPDSAPSPPAKPALWVIETPQGDTRGWLFGTAHALPDDTAWTTPALDRAVEDAGLLVVEVRNLDPQRLAAVFRKLASDEAVPPLMQRVSAGDRADLARILSQSDTPPQGLDRLETWAAALAVARLSGEDSGGTSVDRDLLARFAGRPIAELEGAEHQLAIFDDLPERDQRRLLAAVIAEQQSPETNANALAEAWLAGDLARIETTARRGILADPALYRALASGRNREWSERLAPMLAAGKRPLVAVGAAHMLGDDGLSALLAAQGYRVRRIQ